MSGKYNTNVYMSSEMDRINDARQRSGRCSWDEEGSDECVSEDKLEFDDDFERVEPDFANSFCDSYSEGIGKFFCREVDVRSLLQECILEG
jgi:hypothetical protein